jgi:hypothetical protein
MYRAVRGNRSYHPTPGTPIPRPGTTEEIAAVVAFLLREESSFVTGAAWVLMVEQMLEICMTILHVLYLSDLSGKGAGHIIPHLDKLPTKNSAEQRQGFAAAIFVINPVLQQSPGSSDRGD